MFCYPSPAVVLPSSGIVNRYISLPFPFCYLWSPPEFLLVAGIATAIITVDSGPRQQITTDTNPTIYAITCDTVGK